MKTQVNQKMILVPLALTLLGAIAGLVIAIIFDSVLANLTQKISNNTTSIQLPFLFYFLFPFAIALPVYSN